VIASSLSAMSIFISYRDGVTAGIARALAEKLRRRFPDDTVFFDPGTTNPGESLPDRISTEIAKCDVFVAIVGADWDEARVKEPGDFVRLEVAAALRRNEVHILPVLVDRSAPRIKNDPPIERLFDRVAHQIKAGSDNEIDGLVAHIANFPALHKRRRPNGRAVVPALAALAIVIGALLAIVVWLLRAGGSTRVEVNDSPDTRVIVNGSLVQTVERSGEPWAGSGGKQ
jgi:hypothetical protein